jgi:FMN phosphatase YigB (HAD superfamily)
MSELGTLAPQVSTDKKIKAAFFDGDGVILEMPDRHWHEKHVEEQGLDLAKFNQEFYSPTYNDILRGKGNLKAHIETLNHLIGNRELNEMIEEMVHYRVNEPLLEVVKRARSAGTAVYLATVQESLRLARLKQTLANQFDGIYATCELGFLKVEDEDKHPETQQILDDPPARYFSLLLGGLALAPEQIAFFDDRADNIEIARRKGIQAYLYESPKQVAEILSE